MRIGPDETMAIIGRGITIAGSVRSLLHELERLSEESLVSKWEKARPVERNEIARALRDVGKRLRVHDET